MFIVPDSIERRVGAEEAAIQSRLRQPVPLATETTLQEVYGAVEADVAHVIADTYDLAEPDVVIDDIPGHLDHMDIAVPMFPYARAARTSPTVIGQVVGSSLGPVLPMGIDSVETTGPYVNMRLDRPQLFDAGLREVLTQGSAYGKGNVQHGKTVFIDYSSPNIAKHLGIQHIPTTIVGESLARINEAEGAHVVRANYLGDFGTPFGKILVGIDRYGDPVELAADLVGQMHTLYVRVNREVKTDPELSEAVRDASARLENSDPEAMRVWEAAREANIAENDALYERLGIHFDTTAGESYFANSGQELIDELLDQGIAVEENGVVVIPASDDTDPLVLRRSDGSTLYGTRDLAALRYRVERYNPDIIKYVVGAEQSGHFASVFAVAALSRIIKSRDQVEHVKLGLFADQTGRKLSSRSGATDAFADLVDNAIATAHDSLTERYTDQPERLADVPELARKLGIAAIMYSVLRREASSNTVITPDLGVTREAGTAGYLQYTHARANSIVERAGLSDNELLDGELAFTTDAEWRVARAIMAFPDSVARAAETNGPHYIAKALEDLAGAFSTMYQARDISILSAEDPNIRRSRVALTRSVQVVLQNGLQLLNIEAPDRI